MRKLSHIWTVGLVLLAACHQAPVHTAGQWADYKKAYALLNTSKDSAFYYFNRSATYSTDKEQVAMAYQNMALIQSDAGDNFGAQESLIQALKSLDEHDPKNRGHLAEDYNQLGMTFYNTDDNIQALRFYALALQYADSPQLRAYFFNNQGNSYQKLKAYHKALASYDSVLRITGTKGADYARTLTNLAATKWLQNRHYNAAPELLKSLAIRLHEKDTWGENSSYAHLTDFYLENKPDSALFYARKMFAAASKLHSPDDQLAALRKLIMLVPAGSKKYFQQYQRLEDSLQTARSAAKSQFAVIRYNVEKAKTENLQLQKKNTERRYQLIAGLILSGVAVIWTIWWYRKRKQRLQLQAEREIQENRLKLSQKVHDKVANGIYRIMSEVEHLPELDRTILLDRLENMYNISRNVAHDEAESVADFAERIGSMLNAFKNPALRLAVEGNYTELWQAVDLPVREQLLLVLQELMVNMSKHSQATQAHVGFSMEDGRLMLEYRDDGIGLGGKGTPGKGMQNTVSRIQALNGTVNFDAAETKGLRVLIQLPISDRYAV
ncbi:tetratricopeptide repeat-containing sensor histidine kinase [Mucilaginibacter sp. L3T2-6]|uniref:tetratricopeptide repeat-containing sensor histidine kinase n=1 Tax=Mucilaginibacter sp. L3T2-6 TaxID=3062491 RepID=UPI002676750A|nr:tetratricopeptide repeat-containing sensor histidine kinase [Mucilaginibacter sp. L3T2-6]MDO3641283.1 ATP-binding protein [Mucilaginibacter sp. L3T2-6]MDV6213957.1 ATP-binding protein [Mucilaginibacter sp. L3T2-6]